MPFLLHERTICLGRERDLRDPRDREGIEQPDEHREGEEGDDRRDDLATHSGGHTIPNPVTTRSISLMPTNGAMIPPTP